MLGSVPAAAQTASLEVVAACKPGEGDDQLARAVAEGLTSTRLLPSAQVFNAPGDGGATGLAQFASGQRPRSDMLAVSLGMLGQLVLRNAADGFDKCAPIACLIGERQPVVVAASSPIRTLADLCAVIRENAGSIKWGGRARGDTDHQLCLELTKAAGGDPTAVDYLAGDESTEVALQLMKGEVGVATGDLWDLIQQIRGGTLRALALSSPDRAPGVDIPTFREQGLDLEFVNWRGIVSRRGLDRSLITRFEGALDTLHDAAGWRQLLKDRYWIDLFGSSDDFATRIESERRRVAAVLALAKRA